MPTNFSNNKQLLKNLFAGPFPGNAILINPPGSSVLYPGDFTLSDRPVKDYFSFYESDYENAVKWHAELGDDSVPYINFNTNTGIFAAAFGCKLHEHEGSLASARPLITTVEEADALPQADISARTINRVFEIASALRDRMGDDIPISVPDIQSPFDIAALIWNKADMFVALLDNPDAVHRLIEKCYNLLESFLKEYQRILPSVNMCHCPYAWAPRGLGCWLSEDEVGSMSSRMFDEFCLPTLTRLSIAFGGLFLHCCASADHQYGGFKKIPNLRGLNRVFQSPGPGPAIKAFAGTTVHMVAWTDETAVLNMLKMAEPDSRFLFNMENTDINLAKAMLERIRNADKREKESVKTL